MEHTCESQGSPAQTQPTEPTQPTQPTQLSCPNQATQPNQSTATDSPGKPVEDTKDDPIVTKNPTWRWLKIGIIIILFFTIQGANQGLHRAFDLPDSQHLLHLNPFWQDFIEDTIKGNVDGLFQAMRLLLVAWAGPDVINIVGPVIGSAWRGTTEAVRQMSRAVQGKDRQPVKPLGNK